MVNLDQIKIPIAKEISDFEKRFRSSMHSPVPLLDKITHYILKRKGKQVRPLFVFFSANICGGVSESTYRGAALVELLHTATLVHDDVVDDAYQRRGFLSVNALWRNKVAVLVGDFLMSRGLLLSIENDDFNLLKIVSEAVREMSEGELLQIEKARRLDINEEVYFEIIRKKTASLIAACCACGASSAGADAATVEKMRLMGEHIGIAFQIKDDLLDFGYDDIGKPKGIDIKEKKITLPLIFALNQAGYTMRRKIINLVKNHSENNHRMEEVLNFVRESGGLDYASERMHWYQAEAFKLLSDFPDTASKQSMEQLVRFTTERKK